MTATPSPCSCTLCEMGRPGLNAVVKTKRMPPCSITYEAAPRLPVSRPLYAVTSKPKAFA